MFSSPNTSHFPVPFPSIFLAFPRRPPGERFNRFFGGKKIKRWPSRPVFPGVERLIGDLVLGTSTGVPPGPVLRPFWADVGAKIMLKGAKSDPPAHFWLPPARFWLLF